MGMTGHVNRNPVDEDGDIGTVVRVETSEKILFRLSSALVLRSVKARNDL